MTDRLTDNRRARLIEYMPWMLRDYFTNQGPSTAIVVLLIGFLTILPALSQTKLEGLRQISPEVATRILRALIAPFVSLAAVFATNGIISNDRKLGYYRFLFSKPVSPAAYYASMFVAYGVGLLVVTVVLLGAWALAVRPMFPAALFAVVIIMYLAYGGIGFLLSAAWRFDWLSLVTVLLVANVAWSLWGRSTSVAHWLLYLLPPVHRTDDVYAIVQHEAGTVIQWRSIAWLAGYGLASFVLGIVVIRKRPLGTT